MYPDANQTMRLNYGNVKYTNADYVTFSKSNYDYDLAQVYQYHGFMRSPFGLSFTSGFRVGYIIPSGKKAKPAGTITK